MITISCKKEVLPEAPDFNLKSESLTFEVGKEGLFYFEGNTGIIFFYSGEIGNEYVPAGTATATNKSIAVKGNSDSTPLKFGYTYKLKGVYKACFVAKNANIYGGKEVIRSINVTVGD